MTETTAIRDTRLIAEDFVKLWNASSPGGLAERAYAPDYIEHHPLPGQGPGIDGLNELAAVYFAVFPDLETKVEAVLNDGDLTVVRWSGVGTHQGGQMGVPPTHRRVHFSGIDILRISGGKVVEHWGETNGLEVMQQIQAEPGPQDGS
jgi:predicted ester cyclase